MKIGAIPEATQKIVHSKTKKNIIVKAICIAALKIKKTNPPNPFILMLTIKLPPSLLIKYLLILIYEVDVRR